MTVFGVGPLCLLFTLEASEREYLFYDLMLVTEVCVQNYLSILNELTEELMLKICPDEYKHCLTSDCYVLN